MRLRSLFLSLVFVFNLFLPVTTFAQSPSPSPTPERVDVYGLFWPVVPGTTVAQPTFFFKQIKESLSGLFKSGNLAQADYQLSLSEKRLVEAYKLIENKDYDNALKSLQMNKTTRTAAVEAKRKAQEEKQDVLGVSAKMVKSLENQQKALTFISTQVPQNEQTQLQPQIEELTLQISEAK